MATLEAFRQAQIDEEFLLNHEVGILYGNDSSAAPVIEAIDVIRAKKNTAMVGSGSIFQSMNSTITMNLSVIFHLKGINFTISGACASGSHAIGMAYMLIKSGLQDCILCGGAQEVNPYSVGSFDGLGAFSTREDEPEKASRPFDKGRDGLVPSGGGASLVLESYESAVRRGATILAEVIGYGFHPTEIIFPYRMWTVPDALYRWQSTMRAFPWKKSNISMHTPLPPPWEI